ncbi:hypothetical protein LSTR_LSTR001002 [Laodelphax striatellus]|uniref:C2H2-type domain-containing protein n=1 Tax=Laodelphax striatellus TaxID=195883 RepID=A0A482X2L2_LAOST|nr:hypothetical protein LSTR_LSTR001002 [Laodelphax striatellus]
MSVFEDEFQDASFKNRSQKNARFVCDQCHRKYSLASTLRRHKKYECGKEPMFACRLNYWHHFQNFQTKLGRLPALGLPNLNNNMVSTEGGADGQKMENKGGFTCSACNKSYRWRSGLAEHVAYGCGKEPQFQLVKVRSDLMIPEKRVVPVDVDVGLRPFQCHLCPKSYGRKSHLTRHQRYECGQRVAQFQCPLCPKRTRQKSNLRQHLMVHIATDWRQALAFWTSRSLIKEYKCSACHRSYCRKESLRRHLTFECGKEPQFECTICGKRCKLKSNLQQHVRLCHKDVPLPLSLEKPKQSLA